jgi:mannose/fructose-specific phosphotransferase system component IIA
MNHIILISHCGLARGMYETLRYFKNDLNNVSFIAAYQEPGDPEPLLRSEIEKAGKRPVIIVTDIPAGSVTQVALKLTREYPVRVLSGMNLALLLALVNEDADLTDTGVETLLAKGRESIMDINNYKPEAEDDDF